MLIFLPFFAERCDGLIQAVSLIKLSKIQSYLKITYLAAVIGTIITGITTLALQNLQATAWVKSKTVISLSFGASLVLFFIAGSQPYAAVFAFVLLAIKTLMLIKWR